MKQLLNNSKKNKYFLIAAAAVAAIVIALIVGTNIYKKAAMDKRLSNLKAETRQTSIEFRDKYTELSEAESRELRENLRILLEGLLGRNVSYNIKSVSEIKDILKTYPADYNSIIETDYIYSTLFGSVQSGLGVFETFVADCRLGVPGYMVMAQFTTNLDPIYYYIEYDGDNYHVVVDQTRDGYIGARGYVERTGKYFKMEQYVAPDGTIGEYGFLTDDADIHYTDIIKYYSDVEYNVNLQKPDLWVFYMGVVTPEELAGRVLTPDRVSKDFEKAYTGFADEHPSFADDNPMCDLDGDGIVDRIYREAAKANDNAMVNVYCLLGNGNTITLGRNIWGDRFITQMADVTNDGSDDICFIQYSKEATGDKYGISVFTYKNGNYVSTRLPKSISDKISVVKNASGQYIIDAGSYTLTYNGEQWIEGNNE